MGEYNQTVLPFEKYFQGRQFSNYMLQRWTDSFIYSAIYLVVVFGGQRYMKNRPGFDLRPLLAIWSGSLAVFSLLGAVRTWPELISVVTQHSLQHSVCRPTYYQGVTGFWGAMFALSKVYELGDTAFVVLRKQPLIFLHWFHHITVLIYVWFSYMQDVAPGRWFMVINYTVHACMYSYYTLRALRVRPPRWVNMGITLLQLTQMVVGLLINVWVYHLKAGGESCQQTYANLVSSTAMYLVYLGLFAHFFYKSYIVKSETRLKSE